MSLMPPALIREAVVDDADPVAQLITELGYPTTADEMRGRLSTILNNPYHMTFVAEAGGNVVAVAGISLDHYYEKDGVYARLAVLAVTAPSRGRGIGTQLVDAAEGWSLGAGAREVIVNSGLHRDKAHRFYERRGYSPTGLRFIKELETR